MKYKIMGLFFLGTLLFSCKNDAEKRIVASEKDLKKKEIIFSNINKGWVFNSNPVNATSQAKTLSWTEWRVFLEELKQKPKKTITAFQKKSTEISKKALALKNNTPFDFDVPQIKSRISTLITKVKLLDLFIHLGNIPDQKVIILISEINIELLSLQNQMAKIVQKSKIPVEEGESDLMKMLDTTRAIPTVTPDFNRPRIE